MFLRLYVLLIILLFNFEYSYSQQRYTNDGKKVSQSILSSYDTAYLDCYSYSLIDGKKLNISDEDCERQGLWKFYYPNGKLVLEGTYKNGRTVGVWKK